METPDSGQTAEPQEAKPVASPTGQQPTAYPPELVAQLKAEIMQDLKTDAGREIKDISNRRFSDIEKRVNERLSVLDEFDELKKTGLSDLQARQELRRRELESRLVQPQAPSQPPAHTGNAGGLAAGEVVKAMLPQLGLSDNDPEVTAILRGSQEIGVLAGQLSSLAVKRKSSPPATAAGIAQPAGTPPPEADADKLIAEFQTLQKGGDFAAIRAKAEELKSAGVPGW